MEGGGVDDVFLRVGVHVVGVKPELHPWNGVSKQVVVVDGQGLLYVGSRIVNRVACLFCGDGDGAGGTNPNLLESGVGAEVVVIIRTHDRDDGGIGARVADRQL